MLNLKGAQELSKNEQKNVTGGRRKGPDVCGGDGSFIIVNGEEVCCYIAPGLYIC